MSTGGLVGAVIFGAIGFVIGGPMAGTAAIGLFYGAAFGFALGMAIDPITPDVPSAGAPDQSELVMSGETGTPISDLAGTAKITGHLLCFGKERAVAVYSETEGGKGGGGGADPQATGYKYYMSWAVGIMAGKANTLYAVYKNDDEVVWEGELDCPASGGQETVTLDGMGSATFYFGTADQVANSKVGEIIDDATLNTPYRHLCWCFFDDCYIGEYNRAPTMKFIVTKIPEYSFSDKHEIQTYDCNPAHAKWFILHALTGLPESWLHSTDFAAEALTLWGESRGLSILFSNQQSALTYLESINSHIDSILRYGTDAKFHPKLIRDDYTIEDLPLIDEDVMLGEPTFDRRSWIDTLNEMKVQYTELINVEREKPFGPIWGTGYTFYGNLGLSGPADVQIFTELDAEDYYRLCCGYQNSIIIASDSSLWGTGWNNIGQLGIGGGGNQYSFVQIDNGSWQKACGGYQFNMNLKTDETLWASGRNEFYGQLGLGDYINRNVLTQCLTGVQNVATGMYHTIVVKTNGSLWGAGAGDSGQLGRVINKTNVFLQETGADLNWLLVTAGGDFTVAIKTNSALYGSGGNYYGQLGLGHNNGVSSFTQEASASNWSKVACRGYFTIAIKSNGTLWGTGRNNEGQLGLGDLNDRNEFTQIGTDSDWIGIACGSQFMVVFKSNGDLWGTGRNEHYQLGLNHNNVVDTLTDLSIKVLQAACGASHTVVIKK